MPKITFIEKDKETTIEAQIGFSVLDIARDNNIDLDGSCESGICGTCHVFVEHDPTGKLLAKSEDEEDTLDLVFGVEENSRLACEIIITQDMEGLVIKIPEI